MIKGPRFISQTLFLAAMLSLGPASVLPNDTSDALEYPVKAAFLFRFLKYVEWPENALSATEPLRICVLGTDPFGQILDDTVAGRAIDGHTLEIHRIAEPGVAVRVCHAAYLPGGESYRYRRWFRAIAGRPILMFGETPRFLARGGAVEFIIEDDKVRFDISSRALEQAGLTLSSRILALARRVE